MSKRLQVVVPDADYARLKRIARRRGLTLAEWVRQTLREAGHDEPSGRADRKLAVIRAAARQEFPAGDIGQMLSEIESGYLEDHET